MKEFIEDCWIWRDILWNNSFLESEIVSTENEIWRKWRRIILLIVHILHENIFQWINSNNKLDPQIFVINEVELTSFALYSANSF